MTTGEQRLILTIEDDNFVRKGIAVFLASKGYSILEAADGEEGLALWRENNPDLILTDLRLPKKDGLEILAIIKEEQPETPVIIVSGMGTLTDAIKAVKLGAWDYIPKPIDDMNLLVHAVTKALSQADLVAENKHYQLYLEEEVQRRTAELQQAQKLEAIGTLAGGIAHDFNNILAAIIGYSELALLQNSDNVSLCADLKQILQAGDRAKDLVAQILTFARKTEVEHQPILISPIIKEALKLLRATIPTTVEVKSHIQADSTKIIADTTEIHQVIMNLCTNSFHALTEEQGIIDVRLQFLTVKEKDSDYRDVTPGSYLLLQVTDNGCGMDSGTVSKIFDPFFTTKPEGQGTGLGLSVVHGIVQACGGIIQVNSTPGQGTTFTLLFPVIETVAEKHDSEDSALLHGNERILFVDDEEDLRNLAGEMLRLLGYDVVCVSSGQEALDIFQQDQTGFDLLITDQSMPHMPGTELVQKIRGLTPELPIILCSGYSTMVDERNAMIMGISRYLEKPLTMQKLAREIRSSLDNKKQEWPDARQCK